MLDEAKRIIEEIHKLLEIDELKCPPDIDSLGMTHLVSQLLHNIKDVRVPETLVRIMPAQLR